MSLQTRLASLITAIGTDVKSLLFGNTYTVLPGGADVQEGVLTTNDYLRTIVTSQSDRRIGVDQGRGAFRFATSEYAALPGAGDSVWGNDLIVPESYSANLQKTFTAPAAGKDRIDTVIAVLNPATMVQTITVVAGTEQTAGVPTLANRTGAPAVSALNTAAGSVSGATRYIVLYDVLCKAANSTLVAADVGDLRKIFNIDSSSYQVADSNAAGIARAIPNALGVVTMTDNAGAVMGFDIPAILSGSQVWEFYAAAIVQANSANWTPIYMEIWDTLANVLLARARVEHNTAISDWASVVIPGKRVTLAALGPRPIRVKFSTGLTSFGGNYHTLPTDSFFGAKRIS